MNLNTIATWVGILSGILSIFQIIKEFFKKDNIAVQQQNKNGDNYYIDKRSETKINYNRNSSTTTFSSNSSDDWGIIILYLLAGFLVSFVSFAFYSQVYRILPAICIVFFTISLFKELSIPFTSKLAKFYWFFEKAILLSLIISLFFIPELILNTVDQTPHISIKSLPDLLNWFEDIFNIIKPLWDGDKMILLNLFGRIFGTLMLAFLLFIQILNKRKIHDTPQKSEFLIQIVFFFIFLIILNINSFWEFTLPIRITISTWISPK